MAGVREVAVAVVAAVVTTGAVASAAAALGSDHGGASGAAPTVRVVGAESGAEPVPSAPLPAVTEHAIDPAMVDALRLGRPAGQQVVQVVRLEVIGGELTLATTSASVVLQRADAAGRRWTGDLPPVRVVDARGTHEGWTVRWRVASVQVDGRTRRAAHGTVRLEPATVDVVAGEPEGVEPGRSMPAHRRGRVLFAAEPGWGGGTYEAGGRVTVTGAALRHATSVTVELTFELA